MGPYVQKGSLTEIILFHRSFWHVIPLALAPTALLAMVAPIIAGYQSKARNVNPTSFREAQVRYEFLKKRVADLCATRGHSRECQDLHEWLVSIERDIGDNDPSLRWALRKGYVTLWTSIHAAEEALISMEERNALLQGAIRDRLRLKGSEAESKDLMSKVDNAIKTLKRDAGTVSDQLRDDLRVVRHAINDFRDRRYGALNRVNRNVRVSALYAGLAVWGLLLLVLATKVNPVQLKAACVFYMVGVAVGFFHRAYSVVREENTIDHSGTVSELPRTLNLSGIAAVGGLVVIAVAVGVSNPASTTTTGQTATAASIGLNDIFTIGGNPFRLVLAGAFGLSPELLLVLVNQRGVKQIKSTLLSEGSRDKGEDA